MALVAILTSAAMSLGLVKAPAPLVPAQPDPVSSTPSPGGSGKEAGTGGSPADGPDPPRSLLACIRRWESATKGLYRAISPGGFYRGAYQFDWKTWLSVGGSGDPALATPAEQDYRAGLLVGLRGLAPWPTPARMCT